MLRFYGIKTDHKGNPTRFQYSLDLSETLFSCLSLHESQKGDKEKILMAINHEIQKLYQGDSVTNNINQLFRLTAAKWFRCRDIIQFFYNSKSYYELKIELAKKLNSADKIPEKWQKLSYLILEKLKKEFHSEVIKQFSETDSELNMILKMISLFFIEQDTEVPPPNLELSFIKSQFPKVIWKKKEGFHSRNNPYWTPKNRYCHLTYLSSSLMAEYFASLNSTPRAKNSDITINQNIFDDNVYSLGKFFPGDKPTEIRLLIGEKDNKNEQLDLIVESTSETLYSLQRIILKEYSYDGIKHLLAILRQIAQLKKGADFCFDEEKHFRLVLKAKSKLNITDKQRTIYQSIFELLTNIKVVRIWNNKSVTKENKSSFIVKIAQQNKSKNKDILRHTCLFDPLFFESEDNPYRLGTHLCLIPDEVFKTSTNSHPFLLNLLSYLSGEWLNDFHINKGQVNKSARELFDSSMIVKDNKKPTININKLNSELDYMKQSHYINDYQIIKNKKGNPFNDQYQISASDNIVNLITASIKQPQLKQIKDF